MNWDLNEISLNWDNSAWHSVIYNTSIESMYTTKLKYMNSGNPFIQIDFIKN
jgi:hypothetical protein